ncbi:MAG: GlcG/HbpS family heme-binding protein [Pseudomonadota bacterium]
MSSFTRRSIDIETAIKAAQAAAAHAAGLNLRMSVAVCDEAGILKHFHRMDGASQLSVSISQDKAYTSAVTGMATHAWFEFIKNDPPLLHGIVHTPRLTVFGGGFPIREEGIVVGAIGLSGGHYSQDMDCARQGLAAIGAPAP